MLSKEIYAIENFIREHGGGCFADRCIARKALRKLQHAVEFLEKVSSANAVFVNQIKHENAD